MADEPPPVNDFRGERDTATPKAKRRGQYFTYDIGVGRAVADLDVPAQLVHLTQCRGAGKGLNSSYGHTACAGSEGGLQRQILTRPGAKTGLAKLIDAGIWKRKGSGRKPLYVRAKLNPDNWAFIPNSLVDGVNNQPSPLRDFKRKNDPYLITLLCELYAIQGGGFQNVKVGAIDQFWGIAPTFYGRPWDTPEKIGSYGRWNLWGANAHSTRQRGGGSGGYHQWRGDLPKHWGVTDGLFWDWMNWLVEKSLLKERAIVFDDHPVTAADSAEALFPAPHGDVAPEYETVSYEAASSALDTIRSGILGDYEATFFCHEDVAQPYVWGVFKLAFEAYTAPTLAAHAKYKASIEKQTDLLMALARGEFDRLPVH
jgi:hypothetical protein